MSRLRSFALCGLVLLVLSLDASLAGSGASPQNRMESLAWDEIPGRPLLTHVHGISLTRFVPSSNREKPYGQKIQLRASSSTATEESLTAFIVKVDRTKRQQVLQAMKTLAPHATTQYLPHDSYVAVLSQHTAEQVTQLEGVQSVLFVPPEMKAPADLLAEIHGDETAAALTRRTSKQGQYGGEAPGAATLRRKQQVQLSGSEAELTVSVGKRSGDQEGARELRWRGGLEAAGLGASVASVVDTGRGRVVVHVRGEDGAVAAVSRWLMDQGEVVWVQRKAQLELHALDHQRVSVATSELRNVNAVPELLGAEDSDGKSLVWSRGISGEGQVLAVADTGLDFDNCAFSDPSDSALNLIPFCANLGSCRSPGRHRKVYSYRTWLNSDVGDDVDGHGSHVTGSAVASTLESGFSLQGVAPEAKVAFEDIAKEGGGPFMMVRSALRVPESLVTLFEPSNAAGIKVHSNSWGYAEPRYDIGTQEVDWFMYNNPDVLVVFAAGNDGSAGYQSVGAPAGAKNAISVGAGENREQAYAAQFGVDDLPYAPSFRIEEGDFVEGEQGAILFAEFGASEAATSIREVAVAMIETSDADPTLGCGSVLNQGELVGKVALIRRGGCFFQTKCSNAESAGAVGCMVADDEVRDELVAMSPDEVSGPVSIPSVFISKNAGDLLELAIQRTPSVKLSLPIYHAFDPENVAEFSSRGPTLDMRIKPDIVAVGEAVLSARSDGDLGSNQCSDRTAATYSSGTSMATPQVAAAALLVRQYFEEGFLAAGSKDVARGFSPSAALVKAVILHSGQQMAFPKRGVEADSFPDFDQGHGSIKLSSVLWFGQDVSGFDLAVFDAESIDDGQLWAVCLSDVDQSTPLKATLHWTDPPASLQAAFALVNNIDLALEHRQSGQRVYGNRLPGVGADGASVGQLDDLNNNEQITIQSPTPGEYRVLVSGRNVPVGPQRVAVVLTGSFGSATRCAVEEEERCPGAGACSGHGRCMAGGVCECDPTHAGPDCAAENGVLQDQQAVTTPRVSVGGWLYYVFPVSSDQSWTLLAQSMDWTQRSDPDLYMAYNRVPSLLDFDFSDVSGPNVTSFRVTSDDARRPAGDDGAGDGYWVVGIYGYCCAAGQLRLSVTMGGQGQPPPAVFNPTPDEDGDGDAGSSLLDASEPQVNAAVLAAAAGVGAVLVGTCAWFYCRRKRALAAKGASQSPPANAHSNVVYTASATPPASSRQGGVWTPASPPPLAPAAALPEQQPSAPTPSAVALQRTSPSMQLQGIIVR